MRRYVIGFIVASAMFGDTKVAFSSLPVAVQIAAKSQADGATIIGASRETEKGATTYEVQTRVNGKSRDLSFEEGGKLLAVEQEVALDSLPNPAFEAIRKMAAGRTIKKVESVTCGKSVSYEATVTSKLGKSAEIAVNSDGSPHQD